MKVKKLAIIILMTTFLIILITKVQATTGKINSETVRLRKNPNTKSTILDQLDKGDEVEILEEENEWYKVKAKTEQGTITGYISKDLLDVDKNNISLKKEDTQVEDKSEENKKDDTETKTPEDVETEQPEEVKPTVVVPEKSNENKNIKEDKQYTINEEVGIKILHLINSKEKAKIKGNIKVLEIINDWCRIENDNESGWIRKNALKGALTIVEDITIQESEKPLENEDKPVEETSDTTTEKPQEKEEVEEPETTTSEINKVGYVKTEGLRVRKEPNTSAEELDSLKKNDKVEIIGQSGNWYKIKLNGEIGYVSAKYISDTKIPETTSRNGSTLREETTDKVEQNSSNEQEITANVAKPAQSTSGVTGAAVVEYAKQYLGYKYVSGGASPSKGFDCSGFTSYVYKHFGISLNRTSRDQIKNGVAVAKSDLQIGDVVIFNNDANTAIGHVGIYVGNGNFIHASNPKDGVKITTLTSGYYQKRYVGARRVI